VSRSHDASTSPSSAEHSTGECSTDVRSQEQRGRLRVLYVVQSSERNRHLNALVDHLSRNDVEFLVASLDEGGDLQSDMDSRRIELVLLGGHRSDGMLSTALRLRRLMTNRRVDLVHTHLVKPTLAVELARISAVRPPPVIQSRHHNLAHHRIRQQLHVKIDTWLAKRADRVIAVSEAVRRTLTELEGVPAERVEVVYNGIDADLLKPDPSSVGRWRGIFGSGPAAVAVGRLHPEKDYPTLVRAIAMAREAHPDLSLFIAGRGSDDVHHEIASVSRQLMVGEAVHLVGWVDDVFSFIQAADVFVQASVDEAFSQTVMEAICLGVPVAVTTPGGVAEVVNGWYPNVEPENPEALAVRIDQVLSGRSSATSQLEEAKMDTRSRFSAERLAAAHLGVYREAIGTSERRGKRRFVP